MDLLLVFFGILLGALMFTVRGIWGHQTGGAAFGFIQALAVASWFGIPLWNAVWLFFWWALAVAISSFVGWARHGVQQRFLRGFLAYGVFPNALAGIFLARLIVTPWSDMVFVILFSLAGGLGMGTGFGLSAILLDRFRSRRAAEYKRETGRELSFHGRQTDECDDQVNVEVFDSWKWLMEIPSGALWGLGSYLVLAQCSPGYHILVVLPVDPAGYFLSVVLVLGACAINTIVFRKSEGDISKSLATILTAAVSIALLAVATWQVVTQTFPSVGMLFGFCLVFIVVFGQLRHDLSTRFFRADLVVDAALTAAVLGIAFLG